MKKNRSRLIFDRVALNITQTAGRPSTFIFACSFIIVWAITGPFFNYSDTWQLVANTITNITTFLMVFIIQQTQNKDTLALQLKLNELIAANKSASNRLIDVEDLTVDELVVLKEFYVKLADLAQQEIDIHKTHSVEEAINIHHAKMGTNRTGMNDLPLAEDITKNK